jgi:transcriptional regulator with XRE-family HTH domain
VNRYPTLGRAITARRAEIGMSLDQLIDATKLDGNFLAAIEQDATNQAGLMELLVIASVLRLDPSRVLLTVGTVDLLAPQQDPGFDLRRALS